jgi:hypothetical protein
LGNLGIPDKEYHNRKDYKIFTEIDHIRTSHCNFRFQRHIF